MSTDDKGECASEVGFLAFAEASGSNGIFEVGDASNAAEIEV